MSYRKITVDNKIYEYTIGRVCTKIKTVGVFDNEDIYQNIYNADEDEYTNRIFPSTIAELIQKFNKGEFYVKDGRLKQL